MEFVWVVPRAVVVPAEGIHGFLPLEAAELEDRFLGPSREQGFFMERRYAEVSAAWKQPIPYVVIQRGEQVLCLTRLSTQGETRLHGRRSIGVGGHVNPCDAPSAGAAQTDLFANACRRELDEELRLPAGARLPLTPLGLLNDDRTEVGSVHLGLVYRLDATGLDVAIRETEAMEGSFAALTELAAHAAGEDSPFETWSTLLLRSGVLQMHGAHAKARALARATG